MSGVFLVTSQSDSAKKWYGNDGYQDEDAQHYSFDSKVANGKNVKIGSYLIVKQDGIITGIGLVHALEVKSGMKTLRKCPECQRQTLEPRKVGIKCTNCGNVCSESEVKKLTIAVEEFRATYKNAWLPGEKQLAAKDFESELQTHNIQSAIRTLSVENLMVAKTLLGLKTLPTIPEEFI
jgi:ribosomal protein L37AE/L43A